MARVGIVGEDILGCASADHVLAEGNDVTIFEKTLSATTGRKVAELHSTGESLDLALFSFRRFQ